MNIQWSKILIIIAVYYSALILQGCCTGCSDPDLPYFDYKSFDIEIYGISPYSSDKPLFFTIRPGEIENVALLAPTDRNQWKLINAAYACSCEVDGEWGPKYAITSVNVYSDSIFDASIPEGEPLNKLFETAPTDLSGKNVFLPLDSINKDGGMFPRFAHGGDEIYLTTNALPVAFGRPYTFVIEIIREDGSVVKATTEPVVWQE